MTGNCAVLGGPEPGLFSTPPFIVSGKNSSAFPIAVMCRSVQEASEVMKLQPMVATAMSEDPPLSNQDITLRFYRSRLVSATLDDGETHFWAVRFGRRIGIFRSWHGVGGAEEQVNSTTIQNTRKFSTFRGALVFMISKGKALKGDQMPEEQTDEFDNPYDDKPNSDYLSPASTQSIYRLPEAPVTPMKIKGYTATPVTPTRGRVPHAHAGTPLLASTSSVSPTKSGKQLKPDVFKTMERPFVYQHIRNLGGIIKTLSNAPGTSPINDSGDQPPSLGSVVDSYLVAHGYQPSSIWAIVYTYLEASAGGDFVNSLCDKGMAKLEAEWILQYIQM